MPRPKRATTAKPTNYSDEANSKEPDEVAASSPEPKTKTLEVKVDIQMEGVEEEPAQPSLPVLPNGPDVVAPDVVTADEDAVADNDGNKDDLPSTPPPRVPSRESTASANDGGEFHPESDAEAEDTKPKIKKAPASPNKRKATAPAGGSPTKKGKGASPVKNEAGGGNAKFESTPENRGEIIQEMLRHIPTTKMDWKAIGEITGDNPQKLAKYYDQTFKKHLDAAVRSPAFKGGPAKK